MPYFDHNATTPLAPVARATWLRAQDEAWQNPSSLYRASAQVKIRFEAAREKFAILLGDAADEDHAGAAAFFEQSLKFTVKDEGVEGFVVPTPFDNLSVMPASAVLAELHAKLESRYKIYKLRKGLELL